MRIIIKNGLLIDGQLSNWEDSNTNNLYIDNGKICAHFEEDDNTKIIDAQGKYVGPGLIDLHVHFRDPGLTYKEDILTGSKAASRGGFTTVCCMPNTIPPIDNVETLAYVDRAGQAAAYANVLAVSAMTMGQDGKELCDFRELDSQNTLSKELTSHGICAISEDGKTLNDKNLMAEVCKTAKELNLMIMDHPEPETQVTYRDIELAKKYDCRIHLQHISRKESVDLIRQAKSEGIAITAEAAPHHFVLNKNALNIHGANAKMNPPLAEEKDRLSVLEGLIDHTIDIIATDHAPHGESEKNTTLEKAPFGIVGLETAFPISYSLLVKSGAMSINELIYKMSYLPATLINMDTPTLIPGKKADVVIIDTEEEYRINKDTFFSKGRNTPFHGMDVCGKIVKTIHDGRIVYE